jgi:predicted nucleic acid-binding protein
VGAQELTMYLLDTNVIWALRNNPATQQDEPLFEWVAAQIPSTLFASAISLIEFENGARLLERKDKPAAQAVRQWIDSRLRPAFDGRIIAIDDELVRRWCTLGHADFRDGMLAATALRHGFVIATREGASFKAGRVKTLDPWTYTRASEDLDWRRASRSAPIWLKSMFVRA